MAKRVRQSKIKRLKVLEISIVFYFVTFEKHFDSLKLDPDNQYVFLNVCLTKLLSWLGQQQALILNHQKHEI